MYSSGNHLLQGHARAEVQSERHKAGLWGPCAVPYPSEGFADLLPNRPIQLSAHSHSCIWYLAMVATGYRSHSGKRQELLEDWEVQGQAELMKVVKVRQLKQLRAARLLDTPLYTTHYRNQEKKSSSASYLICLLYIFTSLIAKDTAEVPQACRQVHPDE